MITFMLKKAALLLGVFGVGAWLMYSAQNGNYERQDLLQGIAFWSLIGSLGLYISVICIQLGLIEIGGPRNDN